MSSVSNFDAVFSLDFPLSRSERKTQKFLQRDLTWRNQLGQGARIYYNKSLIAKESSCKEIHLLENIYV